jgi:hypothetical protein
VLELIYPMELLEASNQTGWVLSMADEVRLR